MEQYTIYLPIISIPLIIQVMKMLGLDSKYAPAVCFVLAIILGVLYYRNESLATQVVSTVIYALSSVGLYEYGKNTVGGVKSLLKQN